jgi:hypothetical protein
MSTPHSPERAAAEEKFAKKQRQAEEAAVALSDHEKALKRRAENTARLKALRLARDAGLPKATKPHGGKENT